MPLRPSLNSRFRFLSLAGIAIVAVSLWVTAAPVPTSGTISEATPVINYTGGPLAAGNPTPVGGGPPCPSVGGTTPTCESFDLTVDLPADFDTRRPKDSVRIDLAGIPSADMFLNLLSATGTVLQSSDGNGTSGGETIAIDAVPGTTQYKVRVGNFAGAIPSYSVKIALVASTSVSVPPGPCDSPVYGAADLPCPGNPRYQNFYAPQGTSAQAGSQGEYNIGYNPHTGRIMNMNIGPIWRITPPEIKTGGAKDPPLASGLPESCPEVWENVSDPKTNTGLDPILVTDQKTGRTFATNSTAGAALIYTDNDGGDPPANNTATANWIQASQPPNGGADHEGIGSGPLPASLAALASPQNQGEWVLYCSQDLYAPSMCQRSLTLGSSWENGFPATGTACAGLHGHERIAPDGTGWLPVKHCNVLQGNTILPRQGGSITLDSSTSPWTEFTVEKTVADAEGPAFTTSQQSSGADSSIALDAASTAYYCYVNNEPTGIEGHVHVAVGKRTPGTSTITWIRDTDVGASHGIVNAAHTEAVGGSAGRAACGFIGTNKQGDYQAGTYVGMDWYAYIATTYDEGRTWVTVNATPNDPVQHNTGIWQQGGGGANGNRNLLDFNEITLDDKGRVLYGYSDGCVTANCIARTAAGNDKRAWMRVARQIGGKSLLASFDSQTDIAAPVAPKAPCLLDQAKGHPTPSTRPDAAAAHLNWRAPDNGGADLVNYDIYRGTAPNGPYTLIGSTAGTETTYDDATAGITPSLYYVVRANNAVPLASVDSNEVLLALGGLPPDPCVPPGMPILNDPAGDATDTQGAHDARSLGISEPYRNSATDTLTFTLKMTSLANPLPADTYWPIQFQVGATTYVARMSTFAPATPAAPAFEFYTGTIPTALPAVTTASAGSGYNADGTITLVIPRSGIGNPAVATQVKNFLVRIAVNVGGGVVYMDNMPDNFTATGAYDVIGNGACRVNLPPEAVLTGTPTGGKAPLVVDFSGADSDDPDTSPPADTIASYTFDFGDGTSPVTQSSPTISHTYMSAGTFFADLTVTESRGGLTSANKAEVEIEVEPNLPPVANAGSDFSAKEGLQVLLSGTATDPDNDPLSYQWTQLSGPSVTLDNANTAAARFTAPEVGADTPLTFRLTVSDGVEQSTDDITITVLDAARIGDNKVGGSMSPGALLVLGLLGLLGLGRRRTC